MQLRWTYCLLPVIFITSKSPWSSLYMHLMFGQTSIPATAKTMVWRLIPCICNPDLHTTELARVFNESPSLPALHLETRGARSSSNTTPLPTRTLASG